MDGVSTNGHTVHATARTGEAEELARRISMDQAHAHAERHVQRAVDNLVYWAMRMVESNDRGEVVTGEVRDNLEVVLREVQALNEAQTPETVGWWIGRYLEYRATEMELATGKGGSPPAQVHKQRRLSESAARRLDSSWSHRSEGKQRFVHKEVRHMEPHP